MPTSKRKPRRTAAQINMMEAESSSKGLIDLPPEIWSKICKLAVTYDNTITITKPMRLGAYFMARQSLIWECGNVEYRQKRDIRQLVEPAITRVCRAIRLECLSYFYDNNVFVIHGGGELSARLSAWLNAIGPRNRSNLRHLYYTLGLPRFGWQHQLDEVPETDYWLVRNGDFDYDDVDKLFPDRSLGASWEWFQRIEVENK